MLILSIHIRMSNLAETGGGREQPVRFFHMVVLPFSQAAPWYTE